MRKTILVLGFFMLAGGSINSVHSTYRPGPHATSSWSGDDPIWLRGEHFSVAPPSSRQERQGWNYIVTIAATINLSVASGKKNFPKLMKSYLRQLRQYTKETTVWLKKNGVDPKDKSICWIPSEARKIALQIVGRPNKRLKKNRR